MLRINRTIKLFGLFAVIFTLTACATAKQNQVVAANDDNTFTVEKTGMSFKQVQEAASQGDPDAQYALGYLYYYGKGTTRDENEARFWIKKAAAQGQPEASKALALLGEPSSTNVASADNDPSKLNAKQPGALAQAMDTGLSKPAKAEVVAKADKQPENKAEVAQAENKSDANNKLAANDTENQPEAAPAPKQEEATADATEAAALAPTKTSVANNNELSAAPRNYYTVQLLGAYKKEQILAYIDANQLGNQAKYYKTTHNGKPWYVAVYGVYKTQTEAQAAIKQLPANVQKDSPWVKSIAMVQQGMQLADAGE